jgi:prevent-host-death family protein
MRVAVRELKSNLSRMLSRAQAGEVIVVTSHNKPVARIVGVPQTASAGLRDSISRGLLSWAGKKPRVEPPLALGGRGTPVSHLVLEDRG